jgi:hypothetical protein
MWDGRVTGAPTSLPPPRSWAAHAIRRASTSFARSLRRLMARQWTRRGVSPQSGQQCTIWAHLQSMPQGVWQRRRFHVLHCRCWRSCCAAASAVRSACPGCMPVCAISHRTQCCAQCVSWLHASVCCITQNTVLCAAGVHIRAACDCGPHYGQYNVASSPPPSVVCWLKCVLGPAAPRAHPYLHTHTHTHTCTQTHTHTYTCL